MPGAYYYIWLASIFNVAQYHFYNVVVYQGVNYTHGWIMATNVFLALGSIIVPLYYCMCCCSFCQRLEMMVVACILRDRMFNFLFCRWSKHETSSY
jgi:hypothetical protein